MRHRFLAFAFCLFSIAFAPATGAAPPTTAQQDVSSNITPDAPDMQWWRDSQRTKDQRLAWWREARFGMFIHWGVYSALGNVYHGRKGGGYAEHIQRVLKIPIPEYRDQVAARFNPTKFDADEWVKLAHEAGMGYLVITAKHHDGFAMYASKVSRYNVVDVSAWHHDPMKDLKAACDKYGVRFGFYYSHAFDWGDKDAPGNDWDYNNPGGDKKLYGTNWWQDPEGAKFLPQVRRYLDTKSIPQIEELIHNYHPAILWFDTPHKLPPAYNRDVLQAVRETDPDVVVNGRLLRTSTTNFGDYDSTTDRPAEFPPHPGDWEGIPTTNESYGYNPLDTYHKPPKHFIQLLAKAAARGGNLLLNIGPRGDGAIDPPDVQILQGIARWMKINQQSIQGTTRTPLAPQCWGESTRKGNTLYLHIFNYPKNGQLTVGGLLSTPTSARMLTPDVGSASADRLSPSQSFPITRLNPTDLQITLPDNFTPDDADTVVALTFDSAEIKTDPVTRLLSADSPNLLRTFDARLTGNLRYGPGKKTDDTIMNWTGKDEAVAFTVRAPKPTTYTVSLNYDASPASAGASFAIETPTQTLPGKVTPGKSNTLTLGTLQLTPAPQPLRLIATHLTGPELMRPRSLTLTPAAD